MTEMTIGDLPVAVALSATDKFEIEQASQAESTHLTVAALLAHIDTTLLTTLKGDVDALEVSIGGSGVSLSVVEGRVTATEADITALELALANELTARGNADTAINATITTLTGRVTTAEGSITTLQGVVTGKANASHTHVIADVTGLVAALAGKEPANANIQSHIVATNNPHGVTKTQVGLGNVDNTSDINKPVSTAQQTALDTKAPTVHTHAVASVTGLQAALDGKASATHVHALADVTGLQAALNGKAASEHTHVISDTTGLQAALDAKDTAINTVANNLAAEVTARQTVGTEVANARGGFTTLDDRLDNLAVSAGAITSVFGRTGAITGQTNDYTFAQIGSKPTTLLGYGITDAAALTHVHSAADITSGVLGVARGGTGGLGFQYIISETKPTGVPVGTRWLDSTSGREYTLHQDLDETLWVQWSGGQPIQGTDSMGGGGESGPIVWGAITGTLTNQTDLVAALATKAASIHTHIIGDVTGLQTELDGKALSSHTHAIASVTGLQAALDGKASTTHSHIIGDVTGLQGALDTKAAASHTHTIANTTGLQAALDGKADDSEITTINTALSGKAAIAGQAFTGAVSATTLSDSSGNVRNLLPVTANATTTLDSTHINKVVEKTNTTAYTYTISPSLGVQGDVITVINSGTAGDITIARGAGVALYRATTDGNITVAPGTMATLYRSGTTNRWMA